MHLSYDQTVGETLQKHAAFYLVFQLRAVMIVAILLLVLRISTSSSDQGVDEKFLVVLKNQWVIQQKWCSKEELPIATIRAVHACNEISVLRTTTKQQAYELCLKNVFPQNHNDLVYVRRSLCDSSRDRKLLSDCVFQMYWKLEPEMMQLLKKDLTPKDAVRKLLPLAIERQLCQADALGIDLSQANESNDITNESVYKNGDLALLLSASLRSKS